MAQVKTDPAYLSQTFTLLGALPLTHINPFVRQGLNYQDGWKNGYWTLHLFFIIIIICGMFKLPTEWFCLLLSVCWPFLAKRLVQPWIVVAVTAASLSSVGFSEVDRYVSFNAAVASSLSFTVDSYHLLNDCVSIRWANRYHFETVD